MIQEVDTALEALVRRDALNGSRVDVLFDAPTKDWVARRNAPTVDLYLYDIREDLPRRQVQLERVTDPATGFVGGHRLPTRRFRLSYLITAWTQRPEDEHRLLASLLATFVRHEIIPRDLTGGSLAESQYPVILTVCLPPPQDRTIADVWSALGGELKPSLDLVATAPLDPAWTDAAAKPVLEQPWIGVGGPSIPMEELTGRAMRRRGGPGPLGPGSPALQEEIIGAPLVDAAAEGGTGTRRRARGAAAAAGAPDTAGTEPGPERRGGGRIMRVRGIPRP